MAVIITSNLKKIPDFHVGTNISFSIRVKIKGSYPNITADTVRMIWKINKSPIDSDAIAVLNKLADVTTRGADAYADFSIVPSDTEKIAPREYYCDVQINRSDGSEHILVEQTITLKERVSDV